ncbi:MAG TPA: hypothetical protein VHO03_17300 [Ignavibacteriales bacterium]|nr:hypothetical protein [Ignavibacteriales bacterium]
MDILELRILISNALTAKGFNSTVDPYINFKDFLEKETPEPVVIVESGENSDYTLSANATPYKADFQVSVTSMVYADQHRPYSEFKPEAMALGKSVLKEIRDMNLRIKSLKQKDGEFIVDGIKVSGVTLNLMIDVQVSL